MPSVDLHLVLLGRTPWEASSKIALIFGNPSMQDDICVFNFFCAFCWSCSIWKCCAETVVQIPFLWSVISSSYFHFLFSGADARLSKVQQSHLTQHNHSEGIVGSVISEHGFTVSISPAKQWPLCLGPTWATQGEGPSHVLRSYAIHWWWLKEIWRAWKDVWSP